MKRVGIIRNAEAETNSGLLRVADSLLSTDEFSPFTLTRSRQESEAGQEGTFIRKDFLFKGQTIENYELQLPAETGVGLKNISRVQQYQDQLKRWLDQHEGGVDIIHAFDLDAGMVANRFAKKYKKPFVYHIADFYADSRSNVPGPLKYLLKQMEFRVINQADATIICTEGRKQQIAGSHPQQLTVIHNSPVNSVEKKAVDRDPNQAFTLAYVGHLSRRRFIERVLDIVKDQPDLNLVLAGFGESADKVAAYAEKYDNITFLGQVDTQRAMDIYQKSDLMFAVYDPEVANHRYSAPNKIYEAMMVGKPIIVAKGTGVNDLVDNNKIGVSIDYSDQAFLDAVNYFKDQPDLYQAYADNARNTYPDYSWDKMKDRLIQVYRNL